MNKEFVQWVKGEPQLPFNGNCKIAAWLVYTYLQQNPRLLQEDGKAYKKIFKVSQVRDLINQVHNEKITFSRFVEILNENANPHLLKEDGEDGRNNSKDLRQDVKEDCDCYYTKFCKAPEHLKTGVRCRDEKENTDYKDPREQLSPAKTTPEPVVAEDEKKYKEIKQSDTSAFDRIRDSITPKEREKYKKQIADMEAKTTHDTPVLAKYKVGDRVRVVGNEGGHGFEMGEEVQIVDNGLNNSIQVQSVLKNEIWWVTPTDIEPVTPNILDKNAENVKDSREELAEGVCEKYSDYGTQDGKWFTTNEIFKAALTEMAEIAYERGREDGWSETTVKFSDAIVSYEVQLAEKDTINTYEPTATTTGTYGRT